MHAFVHLAFSHCLACGRARLKAGLRYQNHTNNGTVPPTGNHLRQLSVQALRSMHAKTSLQCSKIHHFCHACPWQGFETSFPFRVCSALVGTTKNNGFLIDWRTLHTHTIKGKRLEQRGRVRVQRICAGSLYFGNGSARHNFELEVKRIDGGDTWPGTYYFFSGKMFVPSRTRFFRSQLSEKLSLTSLFQNCATLQCSLWLLR